MSDDGSKALVRPAEGSAVVDEYERAYMGDGGLVLYRDKHKASRGFNWLMGTSAAVSAVGCWLAFSGTATGFVAGAAAAAITGMAWLVFKVMRVTVTTQHVQIQLGLFGPTIPIDAISSVESIHYRPLEFGGWGVKSNFKGHQMYNMPGDEGRAVRIVWRDARGKARTTLVGTKTADDLAARIEEARRRALPETSSSTT